VEKREKSDTPKREGWASLRDGVLNEKERR
jgi:hypothetical protein